VFTYLHEQLDALNVGLYVGREAALVAHVARVLPILLLDDGLEVVVHLFAYRTHTGTGVQSQSCVMMQFITSVHASCPYFFLMTDLRLWYTCPRTKSVHSQMSLLSTVKVVRVLPVLLLDDRFEVVVHLFAYRTQRRVCNYKMVLV
jgi:hypothetical protein